jgi:hypothetical protein
MRKQINMVGLICMIFMLIEIFDIDINNDELLIIILEFHVNDIYINWN